MESSAVRNRLLLAGAALLFSTGGAAIKAATLTAWQVASFRSGMAAVFLLVALPEARRGWSWRIVPAALAYAGTLVLFVLANRLTTSANAIFLQSTAPLYLLLLGPWLLHEPVRRSDWVCIAAVAAGLVLIVSGSEAAAATAPNPHLGNLVGLASGVTWALTITGLRWLARTTPGNTQSNAAMATVTAGNVIGFLVALPMALPVAAPGAANVAVIVYLGIVQIGIAYVCVTRAIRHVPAFEATTVLLLEPAINPLWAWLVHGERPGPSAMAGGAIILAATLANTWRQASRTGTA
ncbi:MAG TPA: DMT family transporter [Steroidobacteraceae bacterium]|jgi:drug/metabolite transporter (DMT)-like permease